MKINDCPNRRKDGYCVSRLAFCVDVGKMVCSMKEIYKSKDASLIEQGRQDDMKMVVKSIVKLRESIEEIRKDVGAIKRAMGPFLEVD